MAAELVNGMDALAVYAATQRAVERARQGGHPTLLEVRTYRFMGHSMSDPLHGVYRTKDEVDRKSTRLNSSHSQISYAVFCLKKKKQRNLCGKVLHTRHLY